MKNIFVRKFIFKTFILFLSVIFLTISCFSSKKNFNKVNRDFFEGIVTYEIDYSPYSKNIKAEDLKKHIGSQMIFTFKDGNYKKEYYSPDGKLLNIRYVNRKENKAYFKEWNNDTIFWVDLSKNDSKSTFSYYKDSVILNYKTLGIKYQTSLQTDAFSGKTFKISGEVYFAPELPVNPEWYKNFKEANYNEMIKLGKGIQLLIIYNSLYWTQKLTAINVEKCPVNSESLKMKFPEHPIMKEL